MGYWIIVILIVLGGILVFLAAASVGADNLDQMLAVAPARPDVAPAFQRTQTPDSTPRIPVVLFVPQTWTQRAAEDFAPEFKGAITSVTLVERPMIAGLATNVAASSNSLGDSVVTILTGADDYLAGQPLEVVLDQLDLLLEQLSSLPAMAVVGSIPNVLSALDDYVASIPTTSASTTVAIWNQAIADLANAYSAEYVDLSAVPVELIETSGGHADQWVSACPDLDKLTLVLEPAIGRATDRVRSFRTIS